MGGGISLTQWRATRRLAHTRGRREAGRILLEGARAVETVLARGEALRMVLAGPELTPRSARALQQAQRHDVPISTLTAEQTTELSTTAHSQGIFAVVTWRPSTTIPPLSDPLFFYLSGVRNPTNMGALLRTAAAFGVPVGCSPDCVDVTHPVALRSGAASYLDAAIHVDVELAGLRQGNPEYRCIYAAASDGEPLGSFRWPERTILVLGGEAAGATEPVCEDARIRIPITVESLNAAVAGGILLWSATRSFQGST